ncbi:MAG: DUF305 domain-containing protein [Brevundimonas sp.]|uniref:DUF305 domain-containing protein n=1 Tax=Brevundimonas sp. TaxID=1871086 RepID=UPI0025B7F5D6|nr:DUF305 domain-containing protein [Brevundimonas sp.]MBX3477452.1 DUF305 domain-containing protein [Brevundimonas sp.]
MSPRSVLSARLLIGGSVAALLFAAGAAAAQDAPIVQPGAPGQASRTLSASDAATLANNRFSADDVRFMQDMIVHHNQAVQMAALVDGRTSRQGVVAAAGRINATQADEIGFMQRWLRERGQTAPNPAADAHAHHGAGHDMGGAGHTMAGMATPEQMAELAAASGVEFDRKFLSLMIAHHEGAVEMVNHLLRRSGSAYDPVLFEFVNDVLNEQQGEIRRMTAMSRELTTDPRATLAAGFRDAGQAGHNLNLVSTLPKPRGFFDPSNEAGLPPPLPEAEGETPTRSGGDDMSDRFGKRAPFLSFANTDMAFSGDLMAVGNYHGFNLYRLGQGDTPQLITSVVCPGGQGDVSIVGNLLLMSVEQNSGRVDCGREGIAEDISAERFRGLRIFDISQPTAPRQVGQVQTCRGSHTHSVVSSDDRSIIVYNSGTAGIRNERELAGCVVGQAGDQRTALFRVDVIEIPVADPSRARIIDSPTVFADGDRIAGLWQGGDHGEGTQSTARTDHCHDITVFPTLNIAAGACSGNGLIFDITDPRKPQRIDAVSDQGFAYWHSATFNNDGTKVLFTDEWGGGSRPRCRVQDPMHWGANAFYDIVDRKLVFRGYYKLPAPQTDQENCVAHNGSIVPVPGRDIFVQAWYQGGLSVIDFTDSANAHEIAYFDRGPIDAQHEILGGYWSTYWYGGHIYGSEIARGLDVLTLQPSDELSAAEIAAAAMADQGRTFNPQRQTPVTWPSHPVVAQAYVDQLARQQALPADKIAALTSTLTEVGARLDAGSKDAALAGRVDALAGDLNVGSDAAANRRATALRGVLTDLSAKLR